MRYLLIIAGILACQSARAESAFDRFERVYKLKDECIARNQSIVGYGLFDAIDAGCSNDPAFIYDRSAP
jgi:hypothetical protein